MNCFEQNKKVGTKVNCNAIVVIAVALRWCFGIPCFFRTVFSINCLGCGMSRAWVSFLHGNFKAAFSYHYMFWSVPVLAVYLWCNGKLFKNKMLNRFVIIILAAGFVINWLIKI